MATPSEPGESVPQDPPITPEEAAAAAAAQADAAAAAALNDQIRALAAEIAKQTLTDFDPATIRKGTVTAIATGSAPPTLTITISGDTTAIPGVRYIDSYAPEVDDIVLIIKQGTDLVALGEIAGQFSESDWADVTLAAGFSHNGNSNGNVRIRRIWDHGTWKVQLQGGAARASGTVIASALPVNYRPSTRRTVICGRNGSGGSNVVMVDFEASGAVNMVGGTTTGAADGAGTTSLAGLHSHGGSTGQAGLHSHGGGTGSFGGHSHSISGAGLHSHGGNTGGITSGSAGGAHTHDITQVNDHVHGIGSVGNHTHDISEVGHHVHSISEVDHHTHTGGGTDHTHAVTDPAWISFNQVEYFLS